jgi:hypothetical protein
MSVRISLLCHEVLPDNCNYWEFSSRGGVLCAITKHLCSGEENCNMDKIDPLGYFRDKLDRQQEQQRRDKQEQKGESSV